MKLKTTLAALAVVTLTAAPSLAAEPIVGNWRTASGETAAISKCGGAYCITLKSGKYSGKRIGKMSGKGANYAGKITDPQNAKTYTGSAKVSGASLKMRGCVLKVLCRSQTWKKL